MSEPIFIKKHFHFLVAKPRPEKWGEETVLSSICGCGTTFSQKRKHASQAQAFITNPHWDKDFGDPHLIQSAICRHIMERAATEHDVFLACSLHQPGHDFAQAILEYTLAGCRNLMPRVKLRELDQFGWRGWLIDGLVSVIGIHAHTRAA
jgi:hypothetical protein